MRRVTQLGAVLALSILIVPVGAPAQNGLGPPDHREHVVEEFDIPNFCDTGETVHLSDKRTFSAWETEDALQVTFQIRGTYTYGDGESEAVVTDHWAGRGSEILFEGDDQDDPHSHLVTETGLKAFLSAKGSGRVTRDAGNLQFLVHVGDDHEFLGVELIESHGPHPNFPDGNFCPLAIELLGIDP